MFVHYMLVYIYILCALAMCITYVVYYLIELLLHSIFFLVIFTCLIASYNFEVSISSHCILHPLCGLSIILELFAVQVTFG